MSLMPFHLGMKTTTGKSKMNDTQLSFVLCARGDSLELVSYLCIWGMTYTTGKSKMNATQLSFVLCARFDSIE